MFAILLLCSSLISCEKDNGFIPENSSASETVRLITESDTTCTIVDEEEVVGRIRP